MSNFKSHTIKVNTDESKRYVCAKDALLDQDFEFEGVYENFNPISGWIKRDIYRRLSDDKLFSYAGMDHLTQLYIM